MRNTALNVDEDSLDLLCIKTDALMDQYEPEIPPIFNVKTVAELLEYVENDKHSFELYKIRSVPGMYSPYFKLTPCDIVDDDGFIIDNTCHNIVQAIMRVGELAKENHKKVRDYHIFNLLTLSFVNWEDIK